MNSVNEEHFLQHIQKNPDLELARGIYADWLEEQGDDRAELVRLFRELQQSDEFWLDAVLRFSNERIAELTGDTISLTNMAQRLLSTEQQLNLLFDAFWLCPEVRSHSFLSYLISEIYKYRNGQLSRSELNQVRHEAYLNRLDDGVLYTSVYNFNVRLCELAFVINEELDFVYLFRYVVNLIPNVSLENKLFLTILSYYLFDTNVLPDSFVRTRASS